MTPDSGGGQAAAPPRLRPPTSSLSFFLLRPLCPLHQSRRHPLHPHPCPSLHTPLSMKSPCVGLAAASATHLLPATNWSDAAEVVAVSALQSCLSLPRQQGEEGHGEGGEGRVTVGRGREVVDSDKDEHGTQ